MSLTRRSFSQLACLAIIAALLGCSDRVRTYPVRGKIVSSGQPVGYANVLFHPTGDHTLGHLRPHAKTNSAGEYKLSTYGFEDGAPAGDYQVTVVWGTVPEEFKGWSYEEIPEEELGTGPDYLEGRYATPEVTPLAVTVPEQETELPTLEVQ